MRCKVIQSALLIMVFFNTLLFTKPPVLKQHTSNTCWNNSALQLLHTIWPVTKKLLDDKKKNKEERHYYGKGDAFADAYIDFIEAVDDGNQKKIDDASKEIYSQACKRVKQEVYSPKFFIKEGINKGEMSTPDSTINAFCESFKGLCDTYLSMNFSYYNNRTKKIIDNKDLEIPVMASTFQVYIDGIKKLKNSDDLKKLPQYVIVGTSDGCDWKKFKGYNFNTYYDPIGIIDAWNTNGDPGGHFWAYVQDQLDETFPWYKRDDLKPNKDVDALEKLPNTFSCPSLVLYKKNEKNFKKFLNEVGEERKKKDVVDSFAKALKNVAKG